MAKGKTKRTISLLDATNIGIGAIIGAGVFVILGVATGLAGPSVIVAVLVSGGVALLTALSFARLSEKIPREGGAYEFAHELVSPMAGFLTGFLWLASNIVLGAAVSLGFAHYLASLIALPVVPAAFAVCIIATAVNYIGVTWSARLNNRLVATKLIVLLFFIAVCLLFFNGSNFTPFLAGGWSGVLAAAALFFFAYGGFARITTVSEEVINARQNVPKAVLLSLTISILIYIMVSVAAVGVADYQAASQSSAFLATAIGHTGVPYTGLILAIGALAATASVLLTSILGVSRVAFAMSRNGELPPFLSETNPSNGIPQKAVLVSGVSSALLALVGDLTLVAAISSFAMLAYYAMSNFAALRLGGTAIQRTVAVLGMASCLMLLPFLPATSIIVGVAAVAISLAYYAYGRSR